MLLSVAKTFTYVDGIVLAILIGFIIYGLIRGFIKQVIGLVAIVASFVLAYSLCSPLATLICNTTKWDDNIASSVAGLFNAADQTVKVTELADKLTALPLPAFLKNAVIEYAGKISEGMVNIATAIGFSVAKYLIIGLSFLLIFVGVRVACFLLKHFLTFLADNLPIVDRVNKTLGAITGFIKGLSIVYFLLFIINVMPFKFLIEFKLLIDSSIIAGFLVDYNLFGFLFGLLF